MTVTTQLMDDLFQKELPKTLSLNRNILLRRTVTNSFAFDLTDDNLGAPIVLEKGTGKATYLNRERKNLYILDFEDYKNQLNNCAILHNEKLTRRCDYFIFDLGGSICIFNEITSCYNLKCLQKSIKKKGMTEFVGGKLEKASEQLLHSLKMLYLCHRIWSIITQCSTKICLCSYKINLRHNKRVQIAFNRPLLTETDLSQGKGIKYANKEIEHLGFEYRRIGYVPFEIS